jgi:hypothetical protein
MAQALIQLWLNTISPWPPVQHKTQWMILSSLTHTQRPQLQDVEQVPKEESLEGGGQGHAKLVVQVGLGMMAQNLRVSNNVTENWTVAGQMSCELLLSACQWPLLGQIM